MFCLETIDGHKFTADLAKENNNCYRINFYRKTDFEWFSSHPAKFHVTVREGQKEFELDGCKMIFQTEDYEQGQYKGRLVFETRK